MTLGYISIGSNIDQEIHIPACLLDLKKAFGAIRCSSLYESEAVGFAGASFHNLVAEFNSHLSAREVGKRLRQIELDHGRKSNSIKFSSRTLDLDLILYGDLITREGGLHLPRPEIEQYAFVLEPLAEIAGGSRHPVSGKTYAELWRAFDKSQTRQDKIPANWKSNEQFAATVHDQKLTGDIT